jgi:nucleoid DNA-binding protein
MLLVGIKILIGDEKFIVKSELIHETWKSLGKEYKKNDVEIIINTFIKLIIEKIRDGFKIKIDGLGTFSTYLKNVYVKRNIDTGESNYIPNVRCINFSPSKKLKE